MTRRLFEDSTNRAKLELTAMFEALSPEFRASVVLRALRARDHVSAEAGRSLDSAIRGSIRLIGYANPALAISSALLEPVTISVSKSEKLAAAALQVWAESLDELEKLVSGHLASQGLPTEYPDLTTGRFRGFWEEDVWQRELDWIVDLSEIWSEEDVALMLCYVSGRTIVLDEADDLPASTDGMVEIASIRDKVSAPEVEEQPSPVAPEPPPVVEPPVAAPSAALPRLPIVPSEIQGPAILNQCISYLTSLSPEDRNWNESVPTFVEAVSNIRTLKSAQRERRASLLEAHNEISQEFASDLEFLEQDTSFWSAQGLTELPDLDRTLELASSLKSLLTEYSEVRRPGATLSEELGRRERRFALEPRIIDTMGLVRQAMTGERSPRRSNSTDGETGGDGSDPSGLPPRHNGSSLRSLDDYGKELTYEPLDDAVQLEPAEC